MHDLHQYPKRFWSRYGQGAKKGSTIGVEEWSAYFGDLFTSVGQIGQENGMSGVCDMGMHARLFPQPDDGAIRSAAWLNSDFGVGEVLDAFSRAKNGKAPGADGMPMEFLKHAVKERGVGDARNNYNVLAVHIVFLFNLVLKHGYPKSWGIGTLVPVPKSKGDKDNKDDYRGIVVGKALAKLYSMVMLQRLDTWAEHGGLRAKGQAGFRHGRGTPDNAFVLNHIVEKYRCKKKPIYAVFIDFRKAYDCVDRGLLWKALSGLGLHGNFLESLKSMYADVRIRVRANGQLGEDFPSATGVKQGDALSPLLFGLFIDRIEGFINGLDTEIGVRLKDTLLRVLLYADDLVLLAETLQDLQQLLHTVSIFCKHNAMTVNIRKSEAVVFNRRFCSCAHKAKVTYDGVELEVKPFFVYLGIVFDEEGDIRKAATHCINKGRGAMYAMIRRCHELELHNVHIKIRLFDSLVRPIVSYGCEVWGPSFMASGKCLADFGLRKNLEVLHKRFLKRCLGVRDSVADVVLMHELRRVPLSVGILKQVLNFRKRICGRDDEDLVKIAMAESVELARSGVKDCWAGHLSACLRRYDVDILNMDEEGGIDIKAVTVVACDQWLKRISGTLPQQCGNSFVRSRKDDERDGFKTITYLSWFSCEDSLKKSFWHNINKLEHIKVVARFRMGSHWLNVENDRISKKYVPRSRRLCKCCKLNVREDELHVIYCPVYFEFRCAHNLLFAAGWWRPPNEDTIMNNIMNCREGSPREFWHSMATFLIKCRIKREKLIDNFPI
jgi:hypothetical protein